MTLSRDALPSKSDQVPVYEYRPSVQDTDFRIPPVFADPQTDEMQGAK